MVCGLDGLQLNSGSHALRGSARRYSCFGPVLFFIAPSSGKLAGALWQNPQRLWPTMGSDAGVDRPSASPATPEMPPGRTAGSAPFAPALSTSGRFPRKSPPTTEKMHAKKLVALGGSLVLPKTIFQTRSEISERRHRIMPGPFDCECDSGFAGDRCLPRRTAT